MGEIKWVSTPTSSNVERIGYDKERQKFYVDFNKTGTYEYSGFPEEKWNDALNAPSIGKFINEEVRGKYEFEKT